MEDWIAGYLSAFNSLTDDPATPDFLKEPRSPPRSINEVTFSSVQ
jgi:hypothetical protein